MQFGHFRAKLWWIRWIKIMLWNPLSDFSRLHVNLKINCKWIRISVAVNHAIGKFSRLENMEIRKHYRKSGYDVRYITTYAITSSYSFPVHLKHYLKLVFFASALSVSQTWFYELTLFLVPNWKRRMKRNWSQKAARYRRNNDFTAAIFKAPPLKISDDYIGASKRNAFSM